jgi:hypothetical protein
MEDLMLGTKRSAQLWRRRWTRLLTFERALAPSRAEGEAARTSPAELALVRLKVGDRMTAAAKRKVWSAPH